MASFDFLVPVKPEERLLAKALLAYWKKLAKEHTLLLTFKWYRSNRKKPFHRYHVTVEGSLTAAQTFLNSTLGVTQAFVAGYIATDKRNRNTLVGTVLSIAYTKALIEITEEIGTVVDHFAEQNIRINPNSYLFNTENVPALQSVLSSFSKSLILYVSTQIDSEQLAEQAHTTTELLLNTSLNANDRKSYADLVLDAYRKGFISENERDALIELKNFRRAAKHHGQSVPDDKILSLIEPVLSATHGLLAQIRTSKGVITRNGI